MAWLEARRRVEHLGVDAVAVELLEARRGVVPTAPDVLEAHPAAHLLGLESGARVHPERDGVGHAFEHPRVALFEALDARRTVAVLRRDPVDPEVGRLVDVAVGRDQPVRGSGALGHGPQPTSGRSAAHPGRCGPGGMGGSMACRPIRDIAPGVAANQARWDEAAPLHAASATCTTSTGSAPSPDRIRPFEHDEIGPVAGKELLHLQCHLGTDTLSWAVTVRA